MTLLLDTHLLLWAGAGSNKLPKVAKDLIEESAHKLVYSVASLWEVSIKNARGRADFVVDVQNLRARLLANGYSEMPVQGNHILALSNLPMLHRDPFDRILVAQAIAEGFTLLTSDPKVSSYPGPVKMV